MGISLFKAVKVNHCPGAFAVSMTWPDGFKFSYSGDCRPSTEFAKIGQGSTVLLHEATFDDELQGDARAKKHSTTSEALGVGVAMNAHRVILTHFSQRYQKLPVMAEDDANQEQNRDGDQKKGDGLDLRTTHDAFSADSKRSIREDSPNRKQNDSTKAAIKKSDGKAIAMKVNKSDIGSMKFAVAFDLMRVKVGEINQLEKFTPALLKLYENPEEVAEQ
jgi:ribonuclease Z